MIKNNKGQALIESVIILPLSILFFIYVIQVFIYFSLELAIDDNLEDLIFCKMQKQNLCEYNFEARLYDLNIQTISKKYHFSASEYSVYLEARVLNIFKIKKERRLNYEMIVQ